MKMPFAAVYKSGFGTECECRLIPATPVIEFSSGLSFDGYMAHIETQSGHRKYVLD
jgi:hypothetical protein